MTKLDLTNQRFGRLTALNVDHIEYKVPRKLGSVVYWKCRCDCGNVIVVRTTALRRGMTRSCGCLQKERTKESNTKHKQSTTYLYDVWTHIRQRCTNKDNKDYKYYGGRNIQVCDTWNKKFQEFYNWAITNGYKKGLTIDRIDVNGNYCPENCRWVTRLAQSRNTRRNAFLTHDNQTKTISEWAYFLGVSPRLIWDRLHKLGWTVEETLETPIKSHKESRRCRHK